MWFMYTDLLLSSHSYSMSRCKWVHRKRVTSSNSGCWLAADLFGSCMIQSTAINFHLVAMGPLNSADNGELKDQNVWKPLLREYAGRLSIRQRAVNCGLLWWMLACCTRMLTRQQLRCVLPTWSTIHWRWQSCWQASVDQLKQRLHFSEQNRQGTTCCACVPLRLTVYVILY